MFGYIFRIMLYSFSSILLLLPLSIVEMQPQYFYSPRELSRWVRGIYEAVVHMDQGLTREELVRIWAHEALRLFSDRLVGEDEIEWCSNKIDEVA